jgi:hypothetical protein
MASGGAQQPIGEPISPLLLRSEAVASSRIDDVIDGRWLISAAPAAPADLRPQGAALPPDAIGGGSQGTPR